MYSNRYIFIYASLMVIVVATLLSTAAMLLKPMQEKNEAVAKMQGILAATDIDASADSAIRLYRAFITGEMVIDPKGNVLSIYRNGEFERGEQRAFDIDIKRELYAKSMGDDYVMPLYLAQRNGESMYIVPLLGKGLWGPIYGNIAFGPDFNEVSGADFGHDKETPGLGAEINTDDFADQFIGKTIYTRDGEFTSVEVVKGGASSLPPDQRRHGVDAISGGTITSNGVTDMLENCLEGYVPFIEKHIVNKKPV